VFLRVMLIKQSYRIR